MKSHDQNVSAKVTYLSGWEIIMFIFCCWTFKADRILHIQDLQE